MTKSPKQITLFCLDILFQVKVDAPGGQSEWILGGRKSGGHGQGLS